MGLYLVSPWRPIDYGANPIAHSWRAPPSLHYACQVRDEFEGIADTKTGTFDVSWYEDRYEKALIDLVKAKPHKPADYMLDDLISQLLGFSCVRAALRSPVPGRAVSPPPLLS